MKYAASLQAVQITFVIFCLFSSAAISERKLKDCFLIFTHSNPVFFLKIASLHQVMSIERNFVFLVLIYFLQLYTSKGQKEGDTGSIPIDIKVMYLHEIFRIKKLKLQILIYISSKHNGHF